MELWLANMDFQLVLDINKVIVYMKKYVTKSETEICFGVNKMIEKVINTLHTDSLTTRADLKKIMLRLLRFCTISKQESYHLFLRNTMVSCSQHAFVKLI